MRKSTTIIHPGESSILLHLHLDQPFLKRPISFSSVAPLPVDPDPPDISSQLLFILSHPSWQKHPALSSLLPSISPSHVSSLFSSNPNLDPQIALKFFQFVAPKPGFKHSVQTHSLLLDILIRNKFFGVSEKIRISMIKACISIDDIRFTLDFLREMNRDDNEHKFKLSIRTYNELLMMLSRFLMINEMKRVYAELLSDMLVPNIYSLNTMVNAYCRMGNVVEADLYVSKILQAGLRPDTFTYTSLILRHCRNKSNEVSYTNLIHGLCEAGRVDEAISLFKKMKEGDCYPTVRTYTVIIDALFENYRKLEAINLFHEMRNRGCEPNVHTYTVMIDAMYKERKFDESRRMLSEMMEKGLVPSVTTYNALIDGYCKEGMMESAQEILDLMNSNNCSPTERTYNELICGFCKRKNVHKAMSFLSKMVEHRLKPYLVTYNSLIHGQCKVGHLDIAYRLLEMMKENGLAPDQWIYSRIEEARVLFHSLKDKGIKANEVIYTALIDGYCKAGMIDDADSLLEIMLTEGCLPNSSTYNALIDGLCKERKVKKALLMLENMVQKGVRATVSTYTSFIVAKLKEGDFDHAHRLFAQMISLGIQPDVFIYTAFIHSYCVTGNLKEAEDMMARMVERGVMPDALTYTLFIDAYGCLGLLHQAFDHLSKKKLIKENNNAGELDLVPNVSFVDVADVWKTMEFETAKELFEKMLEHGCSPNANTYGKLIIGLCEMGRMGVAQRLFDHMHERGICPNEDIYNSLLDCCCELGMYGDAVRLADAMIECGHLPLLELKQFSVICFIFFGYNDDEVAWKILIDGLLKMGLADVCSELLSIMEREGGQIHPQTYRMLIERLDGTNS
ncbi:hypothetical protein P3X46_019160 [Hevea brasiliensis]|uniref:Pentacotripeptide-repeat region of PRORP domain-containing protein n=1 Tax=Hevea brasiliensis TaxID=3981 RepID=A0ABQ9LT11_HEVBR|nr:hypothetical protein P3X46_019160 [Hevea brasiliensis]